MYMEMYIHVHVLDMEGGIETRFSFALVHP